jgi:hypothetical protein
MGNKIMDQVFWRIWDQVWEKRLKMKESLRIHKIKWAIFDQALDQVSGQVSRQIRHQVRDQVADQVLGQVCRQLKMEISNEI